MLAIAASGALDYITSHGFPSEAIKQNVKIMRRALANISEYRLSEHACEEISPLIHIWVNSDSLSRDEKEFKIEAVVRAGRKKGIYLTRSRYIENQEQFLPEPSLKICVSAGMTQKETEQAAKSLAECLRE